MLVLTRKVGERVGIDAPRGIRIQRDEVVQAVSEANQEAREAAATSDPESLIKKSLGL